MSKLLRTFVPSYLRVLFLFLWLTGDAQWVAAQETPALPCEEGPCIFTGIPVPTPCTRYSGAYFDQFIGAGTPYTKSSLLGPSISGYVHVVGNFVVDEPFAFENAVVKINPGVTISINPSPNGFDPGATLRIEGSELFACNGMWNGITLDFLSVIETSNSTIEDAETAISANGFCALFLESTTFNRDLVGIVLNAPYPNILVPGPQVWKFSGNHFTCDAPLNQPNSTGEEITNTGIKLKNSVLYTFQSGANTFSDLRTGIRTEGKASYLGAQNLSFTNIRRRGIYMEEGNLELRSSTFHNGQGYGVDIQKVNNVSITGNCKFTWNNDAMLPALGSHIGILLQQFSVGSRTRIVGNKGFQAEFTQSERNIRGIQCFGTDIGGGSTISIVQNTFNLYTIGTSGGRATGIEMSGDFPVRSQILMDGNTFDISGPRTRGIQISGIKYDCKITWNRFASKDGRADIGIELLGSNGMWNEVSDNHFAVKKESWFDTHGPAYRTGISVSNFKNTKFCGNTFQIYAAGYSFDFFGPNDGTNFTRNTAYGSQLLNVGQWIEDQNNKGNQWTLDYQGQILTNWMIPQAICVHNYISFSEFFVHTPQSINTSGLGFFPYHPRDIDPDDEDEWWAQNGNTPSSGACGDDTNATGEGQGGEDSNLKAAVADGSLAALSNEASMIWQAEAALFLSLKRNPTLANANALYPTFLSAKTASNIDKLYQVSAALDTARSGSASLIAAVEQNQTAIESVLADIETFDLAWQNAATPAEREAAQNAKKQKLGELTGLLQQAAVYETSYKQGMQTGLTTAEQLNNSITPASDWEGYAKTVCSAQIDLLQQENITLAQKQQIEAIAAICPKYGGMAVYQARNLFSQCVPVEWDNYAGCYPAPPSPAPVGQGPQERPVRPYAGRTQLWPNPAGEQATLYVPDVDHGHLQLTNALGQVLRTQTIESPQTTISLGDLSNGVYYVNVRAPNGQRECLKLLVSHQ